MSVTVIYLGRLRDLAGTRQDSAEAGMSISTWIARQPSGLADALTAPGVTIALNKQALPRGTDPILQAGDELAFMPPFSGG
jgi:sulfur-carrier protein